MSIRAVKNVVQAKPTIEGAGVHLRRAFGFGDTTRVRSVPAARRFPQRTFRRTISRDFRGIRIAASRPSPTSSRATCEHGDSLGNHGSLGARRHPVDDRRQRHHPSGNAPRGHDRPHARLPALGQSPRRAEDDVAALSGQSRRRHPGSDRRRRHERAHRLRRVSGARRVRSTASPPTRSISTSPSRPGSADRSRSKRHVTPSRTSSTVAATSAMPPTPHAVYRSPRRPPGSRAFNDDAATPVRRRSTIDR